MSEKPTLEELDELVELVEGFLKKSNISLFQFEQKLCFNVFHPLTGITEERLKVLHGFTIPLPHFIEFYIAELGITARDFRIMIEEASRRLAQRERPEGQELLVNAARVLGVDVNSPHEEIKQAYRRHVKDTHPDLHPDDPQAAEKFKEVNRAYELLIEHQEVLVNREAIRNERDIIARDEVRKRKEAGRIVVASGYPSDIRRLDRIRESLEKAGIPFEVERVQPSANEVGAMMRKIVIYVTDEYKDKAMKVIKGRK